MENMKIEIHGIKSIEKRAENPWDSCATLISIGDTGAAMPNLVYKPKNMLRVEFDDVTLQTVREEFNLPEEIKNSDSKLSEFLHERGINIFCDEQANQIAEFVIEHFAETDILVCQCHYGQSRSAGCAAAIAEYFFGKGINVFADDRYYPNKLVYRKVLLALKNKGGLRSRMSRKV